MSADENETGKIFVGGLSLETTKESLCSYFSKYGEIVDSVVMKNGETGKPRGFGFITFKHPDAVSLSLSSGPHYLDGKMVDPKPCAKRNTMSKVRSNTDFLEKKTDYLKVFLGGLPLDATNEDIIEAFQKCGPVSHVTIMMDPRKKPRGFGFVTFSTQEGFQQACSDHFVSIKGKEVECKAARPQNFQSSYQPQGPPQFQHPQVAQQAYLQPNYSSLPPNPGMPQTANVSVISSYAQDISSYGYSTTGSLSHGYSDNVATLGQHMVPEYGSYQKPPPTASNHQTVYSYSPYSAEYATNCSQPVQYPQSVYSTDGYTQQDSQYGPLKNRNFMGFEHRVASSYAEVPDMKSSANYPVPSCDQSTFHPYKR